MRRYRTSCWQPPGSGEKMVSAAAEANDELMDKYLESGELSEADIVAGLRKRTVGGEIQPVLCGSAFKNKGVQRMLDAVIELMPSPQDVPAIDGVDEKGLPAERHRRRRTVLGAGV